ncbi:UNVERIFIED_CONTAM: putative cyclic nucleotide-gated ion channel 5 [Sesamum latifolium]|uniref:Cyclic nucleotide-gated ion channel 5 n=1 Tax=Sesamum latifolium TaxID=2727402 RepID=A0AAW2VJC4_9LAMI
MFDCGSKTQYIAGQRDKFVRAVFPEDLKVSEKKIFDPQDKLLTFWNKLFVTSCILGVSVDPLFFFLPVFNQSSNCLDIDRKLAITATTLRTIVDASILFTWLFNSELRILLHHLGCLDEIVVWRFLQRSKGSDVLGTKQALFYIILLQYIPRFARVLPLTSELKRTSGVFAETAWAGAVSYLLLYMLASHIVGAFWYLLSVERNDTCWQRACKRSGKCITDFLYCGNQNMPNYNIWSNISDSVLTSACPVDDDKNMPFDFGIFRQALSSGIVSSRKFLSKYCYCLWWGLQNLSTLGQGLQTSTFPGESIFSIALAILGLILFALLIGNMQTYLQSLTIRLEEMRVKRRDSEQWMHHRLLPSDLRERVRRYDQYKWSHYSRIWTRGCLMPFVRLKPCLYTENTYIVREGDPVDEMIFLIRGRLESVTTDGGRSGFFNRSLLKEGDFCGEELLTWALDPKSGSNLPSSTRTVKALNEVEAFALTADELKFVASQFRRLHSRQVQHTFRFYSQQWRTWAACFIQAAWRRYSKRKLMELKRKEEEEAEGLAGASSNAGGGSYSIGATFLASRFAANALRGVHRNRNLKSARELVKLQKPPEPDFTADAD